MVFKFFGRYRAGWIRDGVCWHRHYRQRHRTAASEFVRSTKILVKLKGHQSSLVTGGAIPQANVG